MNKVIIRSFACISEEEKAEKKAEREEVERNPIYIDVEGLSEEEVKESVNESVNAWHDKHIGKSNGI